MKHFIIDNRQFFDYLREWECEAKNKNYDFITNSTCYGLKITLKGTLQKNAAISIFSRQN